MGSPALLLSCDWGTSRFRLRLVDRRTARVLAEHASADGAQPLAAAHRSPAARRAAFGAVLRRGLRALRVADRPDIPLVISGMACSTLGWRPLPYAPLPAGLDGAGFVRDDLRLGGRAVRFLSGLRARDDVLRGEECELVGLYAGPRRGALPRDGVVVLPGTHAKQVRVRRGRITDFTTHPTGELFALLTRHSTLCAGGPDGLAAGAFRAGVRAARELGLGAALFKTRARTVLGRLPAGQAPDFLSGVLIGAELAALPAGLPVVLAAGPALARRYRLALRELRPAARPVVIPPGELARAVVRGHLRLAADL